MMRAEYEERAKPTNSPWEEHQCSGTLKRLQEEYEDVFDPKWIKWNDYSEADTEEVAMLELVDAVDEKEWLTA